MGERAAKDGTWLCPAAHAALWIEQKWEAAVSYRGGISYLARPTVLTSCPHHLHVFSSGWILQFALNPFSGCFQLGLRGGQSPVTGLMAVAHVVQVLGYPHCSPFFLLSARSLEVRVPPSHHLHKCAAVLEVSELSLAAHMVSWSRIVKNPII